METCQCHLAWIANEVLEPFPKFQRRPILHHHQHIYTVGVNSVKGFPSTGVVLAQNDAPMNNPGKERNNTNYLNVLMQCATRERTITVIHIPHMESCAHRSILLRGSRARLLSAIASFSASLLTPRKSARRRSNAAFSWAFFNFA